MLTPTWLKLEKLDWYLFVRRVMVIPRTALQQGRVISRLLRTCHELLKKVVANDRCWKAGRAYCTTSPSVGIYFLCPASTTDSGDGKAVTILSSQKGKEAPNLGGEGSGLRIGQGHSLLYSAAARVGHAHHHKTRGERERSTRKGHDHPSARKEFKS